MFGFISKQHHEAVIAAKDAQIALLQKELEDRRHGEHRLTDLVFKHQFAEQVFDTLPQDAPLFSESEPEMTETERLEAEYAAEQAERKQRLTAIAKTKPSQLGRAMTAALREETNLAVKASHPAQQLFSKAASEVTA